jgi:Tol biopolymer transport system component
MNKLLWLGAVSCGLLSGAAAAVEFQLVSLRSDGAPPALYSDGSQQPAITANGRYVVFLGSAPNLTSIAATGNQVYLRDRLLGTTELISVSTTGGAPDNVSSNPSVSDDGCRVAFTSAATNLVAGDTNARQDVFVRDRCNGPTTVRASVSSAGVQGNAGSVEARISADGKHVVFVSDATNLAAATGSGFNCLFKRDLDTSTTTAITTSGGACIQANVPDISADGQRVVFWAQYSPGTVTRVNGVWQIFMHDFAASPATQPTLVSTSAAAVAQSQGNEGVSTISAPAISVDGGYVAFASRGSGLVAAPGGTSYHVYVKELATGAITRASVDSAGVAGNGDSSGSGQGFRPGLSRNGKTVTFLTSATNLAPETGGFFPNVVAHVFANGATSGFTAANTLNGVPAISADGDIIVSNSNAALDSRYASRGIFLALSPPRLGNISTRMQVLTGNDRMIAGFIVGGTMPKTVVVNVAGPSLNQYGLAGLANPKLTLVRSSDQSVVKSNDDWQTQAISGDLAAINASGFKPNDALEPAIIATLPPGAYTAIVEGSVAGTTGVGVVGVFEVSSLDIPLINISTRGQVLLVNDVMIAGFIVQGIGPKRMVINVAGPSLNQYGLNGVANPTLTLVRSADQAVIASNDDWQTQANPADVAAIMATGFQPNNPLEPALIATLAPGAYTAIVQGANNGTGVGLVGVFIAP